MSLGKLIKSVEAGTATRTQIEELAVQAFGLSDLCIDIGSAYARKDLNAALAVHDALLPGWAWTVDAGDGASVDNRGDVGPTYSGDIPGKPSRSWLLAILRAKEGDQP